MRLMVRSLLHLLNVKARTPELTELARCVPPPREVRHAVISPDMSSHLTLAEPQGFG